MAFHLRVLLKLEGEMAFREGEMAFHLRVLLKLEGEMAF